MGCRTRKGVNNEAAPMVTPSDALLLTTMYIIGLPVDVHVRDGSVYSGIFHTASVDNDYSIVLKKARMIKKGNKDMNVLNTSLIETLLVQSDDLVQVVVKGVPLPANGITRYVENGIDLMVDSNKCLERQAKTSKLNGSVVNKKQGSQERQVGDVQQEKHLLIEDTNIHEDRMSSLNVDACESRQTADENVAKGITLQAAAEQVVSSDFQTAAEDQTQQRLALEDTSSSEVLVSDVSVAAACTVNNTSGAGLPSFSTSTMPVDPKKPSFSKTSKESRLNPGAKVFSPSLLQNRSVVPALPMRANVANPADSNPVSPVGPAQQEVDISSYAAHSSVPVKLVPYNNAVVSNAGGDPSFVQPIVGQLMSWTHPVRYVDQYHNHQAGLTYVHPNPQNVMIGRMGPLVRMHPISTDVIHSAAGFTQTMTRPHLTPYQVQLPKHQGGGTTQALQLSMTSPIMANGQQPFAMPGPIPISQPLFPVMLPVPFQGFNGFVGTKYA